MVISLEDIREFMEEMDIPGRDLYDIPSSDKTFPDGTHYRIVGIVSWPLLGALVLPLP